MEAVRARRIRVALALGLATFLLDPGRAETPEERERSFVFRWKADGSRAVTEYSSHVNEPFVVEFLDEKVELPDASAAQTLLREHGILLSDEASPWDTDSAHLLLATLRGIGKTKQGRGGGIGSKWLLTAGQLEDDIEITRTDETLVVRISAEAFAYAAPRAARVEGRRGTLQSKRLHHAVVRYVTDEGRDRNRVERLLRERYGVSVSVPDYAALTRSTTVETAAAFQGFHPDERLEILEQFEELPPTLRRMQSRIYLVRRLDGTAHPLYPQAPAVSWPTVEPGYIEFMEQAFIGTFPEHTQRLILHEKAHFLWTRVLSEELKSRWSEVGGWQRNREVAGGWTTESTAQFVSPSAHATNPVEDLAESFAYFVVNPDKLRSRSPAKYDLVRDAITAGGIYLSRVREDLTFQVDNLAPDYVYPARIRGVSVSVEGAPRENKLVTIDLELDSKDHLDTAQRGAMRISSESGTYVDLHLRPVDSEGQPVKVGSLLRGQFTLSKHSKSGYWWAGQIALSDAGGNQRYQGPGDYGWKMHVDNPQEDPVGPQYVPGSLRMRGGNDMSRFSRPVQTVTATWSVKEDVGMPLDQRACSATLVHRESGAYSFTRYGLFDEASGRCSTEFIITEYAASGTYSLSTLRMSDTAGNVTVVPFVEGKGEAPLTINVFTSDPDSRPPELDLNDIQVSARPTRPDSPNGETRVTIAYRVRDDRSGLGWVSLNVRDPQGVDHLYYHYHDNFHSILYNGDPTGWTRYEKSILLPEGSVPGTWGVSALQLRDKANNIQNHDFSETLRFEVSW